MNREKHNKCQKHAFELICSVTNETETEQFFRYRNDAIYKRVIDHLTQTFLLIATNEHFQQEKEMEYLKAKHDLAHFAEMVSGKGIPEYQKQLLNQSEDVKMLLPRHHGRNQYK